MIFNSVFKYKLICCLLILSLRTSQLSVSSSPYILSYYFISSSHANPIGYNISTIKSNNEYKKKINSSIANSTRIQSVLSVLNDVFSDDGDFNSKFQIVVSNYFFDQLKKKKKITKTCVCQ